MVFTWIEGTYLNKLRFTNEKAIIVHIISWELQSIVVVLNRAPRTLFENKLGQKQCTISTSSMHIMINHSILEKFVDNCIFKR